MAKRSSSLADLDIEQEGLAQQDGLAARLARHRGLVPAPATQAAQTPVAQELRQATTPSLSKSPTDPNAWRRGKALLQVALPEDIHVELAIIAKRRRMTLSQVTKEALNSWLETHGHHIRIPD
jgi:hypothetical protein